MTNRSNHHYLKCIYSCIPFIKGLLCARHCSKYLGYMGDQNRQSSGSPVIRTLRGLIPDRGTKSPQTPSCGTHTQQEGKASWPWCLCNLFLSKFSALLKVSLNLLYFSPLLSLPAPNIYGRALLFKETRSYPMRTASSQITASNLLSSCYSERCSPSLTPSS